MASTLHTAKATGVFSARTSWTIAALLALTHVVLAVTAALNESPTFDEPTHLTAGYSYWLRHDYRLDPENGNLPARWASLPLIFRHDLRFPDARSHAWEHASSGLTSRQFLFELGNDAENILLSGRLMMSVFGAALCLLVFAWTRSLFGTLAGLISETLMAFDPNMLAHSALVTSDVAAAFFFTAAVWSIWRLFHVVRLSTLIVAALSVAGLFLTKMSAPCFLLMAGLLGLVRLLAKEPIVVSLPGWKTNVTAKVAKAVSIAVLGTVIGTFTFVSIWAAFGFRFSALTEKGLPRDILNARWDYFLNDRGSTGNVLKLVRDYRILPEAFVYGATYVTKNSQSRPSFLDENWSNVGFRDFFLRAFLYKTPLGLIALMLLGGIALAAYSYTWQRRKMPDDERASLNPIQLAPVLVVIAVYALTAWLTKLNIGHRHLLPLYPAIFVLSGSCVWFLGRHRSRILSAVLVLLISWDLFSSFAVRPHYLAYFNESIGGPANGYKHLVDSSLDWGQDLPELKSWLAKCPPEEVQRSRLYLGYFGTADPEYYGIDATILPEERHGAPLHSLGPGLYCISATILQHVYERERGPWAVVYEKAYRDSLIWLESPQAHDPAMALANPDSAGTDEGVSRLHVFRALRFGRLCAYLRHQKPVANIGYSILVFRLSEADINAALNGPPAELTPRIEVVVD